MTFIINPYQFAAGSSYRYLLDEYGTGIAAAWAMNKLKASYSGSCIRVRESSGNTEADIGFDGDGFLDQTALLAHCGSNDGFVVKWYDQDGNTFDLVQSTSASQPKIVNAGAVLTVGGIPYMDFDGTNDFFNLGDSLDPAGSFAMFFVGKADVTDTATFWSKSKAAPEANRISALIDTSTLYYLLIDNANGTQSITESAVTTRNLYSHQFIDSTSHSAYRDGSTIGTDSSVGTLAGSGFDFLVGAYMSSDGPGSQLPGYNLDGYLQIMAFYHADKSADRDNIRDLINEHYAVF
jgi:hypothetical protein